MEWTLKNGFTVSANKTVAMHFCLKRNCYDPNLMLGNNPIEFVKEFKFLGLVWDSKLTFKNHIAYLKKKCRKSLNLLKVLSFTNWGADTDTLLKLYRSLIRSKLDYGSIVYGSANNKELKKLDVIHNQGLRLSLGAFCSSPVESLYVEAGEQPLALRRNRLSLQYGIKIKANPDNAAYDVVGKPQYKELYENEQMTDTFGLHIKKELKKAKIQTNNILETEIPHVPVWELDEVPVSFELAELDKKVTPSEVFVSKFREVQQQYNGFCQIYTDGSKVNEKASSAVYSSWGKISFRITDNSSIFTAEMEAINKALKYVEASWSRKFVIFCDSKSVLQSISSQESKNPLMNKLLQFIQTLQYEGKQIHFCWVPSHVGIRGNEMADKAAKEGLSKTAPVHYKIPYTDYMPNIKAYVKNLWQERWNNQVPNKLYEITQVIKQYQPSKLSRKEEVLIHRIRIGHTRLTHSYLMERKPLPRCQFCNADALSVKHIMLECRRFMYARRRFYSVTSMKDLFDKVPVRNIIDFVKDVGLYEAL